MKESSKVFIIAGVGIVCFATVVSVAKCAIAVVSGLESVIIRIIEGVGSTTKFIVSNVLAEK